MSLREEIGQQPEVAARLLELGRVPVAKIARAIRGADVEFVVLVARGTSDHAATYAQYVFGVRHRVVASLAAPAITTVYGSEPRMSRALVIGTSASRAPHPTSSRSSKPRVGRAP
jgi:glucosamine--fructose-6-phosphate aminotransferase (isomerizing)